jgi:acyl-CoA dehydrogenase
MPVANPEVSAYQGMSIIIVQDQLADSWIEVEQFRLLVLHTAWLIDKHQDYLRVRKGIEAADI